MISGLQWTADSLSVQAASSVFPNARIQEVVNYGSRAMGGHNQPFADVRRPHSLLASAFVKVLDG